MNRILAMTAVIFAAGSGISHAQAAPAAGQAAPAPQGQTAPGAASASGGLIDLAAMTFGCPRAGLNAAAREAAKVPSQGTYQFAYFRIINDAHHASYEVHFKSNYEGEADLKYCVAMYCQQGWDPNTTKTSVTLMSRDRARMNTTAHGTECGKPAPASRPAKR